MLELNLKRNDEKISITDTEILKVFVDKLFVCWKIWTKFLFVIPLFWDNVGRGFYNFFSFVYHKALITKTRNYLLFEIE